MRTVLIFLLALSTLKTIAQNKINSYQYWFDGQYSSAVSQGITPTETYSLTTQINTSSLLNGLHLFNIKFKDDSSRLSQTLSAFFYKTDPASGTVTISAYQYWFDDNFANSVTQTGSGTASFIFSNDINTNGLLNGLHVLHVRFKDNANLWSETLSQFFYKAPLAGSPGTITAYQYWFDQNFAGAAEQSVTPGGVYTLSAPLDAGLLLAGLHVFTVRFLDNHNTWSSTSSQFFYKPAATGTNNITRYQYWYDQDFAGAVQQVITPSTTYHLTAPLNATALLNGLHTVSVRFSDVLGKWSSTTTQFFYKEQPDTVTENKITAYRYWFDEGDSILNLVDLAPFMNPFSLNQNIAADGMDSGQHVIHFQFRDIKGQWSMVSSDTATVIAKAMYTFSGNGNWSDANNWVNKIKPPAIVTGTYNIFIDPLPGGQCILDVSQEIKTGAIITIRSGKSLVIPGYLNIRQ